MSGIVLSLGDGFPKFRPELSAKVKELQGLLRKWGYQIPETGHFDWATDGAVVHFQGQMGIRPDAKVTADTGATWKALLKDVPKVLPGASFSIVDIDPVPFIHQFDEIHVKGAGNTGCFAACETMLRAVGVKQAGATNKFQIITKETWKTGVPTHTIDAKALTDGLTYMDAQLAKGIPVMVGVSYGDGSHNEGITEHFVVIFEKEADGSYTFHDPATSNKAQGASRTMLVDATSKNLYADGIVGQEGYAVGAKYYVTMVRKNVE